MSTPTEKTFRILRANGVRMEPLNEALVMELVRKGELCAEDQIQRMGSDRWRTIIQLAPHLFVAPPAILASEQLAYEEEFPSIPPFSPSVDADAPIELSPENEWMHVPGSATPSSGRLGQQEKAEDFTDRMEREPTRRTEKRTQTRSVALGTRAGAGSSIAIIAWIFAGLLALESLRQVDRVAVAAQSPTPILGVLPFGGERMLASVLVQFRSEVVRSLSSAGGDALTINGATNLADALEARKRQAQSMVFRVLGISLLIGAPHVYLAVIPGGILLGMLLSRSTSRARPFDEKTMWWTWTTWASAPIAGYLLIRIVTSEALPQLPLLIVVGASAAMIPAVLIPGRVEEMLRDLFGDFGSERFFRLGSIASKILLGGILARCAVLLLVSFGGEEGMGSTELLPFSPQELLTWITGVQVAGIACMAWWAVELALLAPKLPREGEVASRS